MKLKIFVLASFVASFFSYAAHADGQMDPKANPAAEVVCGNARFTVLTDRLIRMEWDENGRFEDNASLAIINRNLPVPQFDVERTQDAVVIKTASVQLRYEGNGRFTAGNLSVSFKMNDKDVTWKPGMDDSGNLMGTTRTLDGCIGFEKISKRDNYMEQGVLSRDGWAIVDESSRHILVKDDSSWGEWVSERPEGERQDLYIFAYGHNYIDALSDFIKVAGRIPLPPKYTFGYWWSRYWAYTDDEMIDIASQMRQRDIPMDIFIIDMDWHLTWKSYEKRKGNDDFGQRPGWTGYTWNYDLIADPVGLLGDLHKMNYKIALNLHPASGIRACEDCYDDFLKDYLSRTDDYDGPENYIYPKEGYQYAGYDSPVGKEGYRAPVPYRMSQQAWADAYFNSVIHPLEKQGVDFWWLDWQQWRESRYCKDLSSTFWINYTFFNDKVRQSRELGLDAPRPFIYHRWGGLGSHRYQLGFSGDTYDEWSVLDFLPYFTATASNVCYGYWGHDIGGHMQMAGHHRPTEPEMYTRWLQYGVFTPLFRTHSTADKNLDRRIWIYEDHYQYMRDAVLLRYALTPYIYDAARYAYDSGVSITRPLYYYYPEDSRAYERYHEFFFGDNILATVICKPAGEDGKTAVDMWFPAGNDWYDMAHHTMIKGGCEKTLYYTIAENPWYAKAGSIIPLAAEGIENLQDDTNEWRIMIIPGTGKAEYTRYEDDGTTQNYVNDYALTRISKEDTGNTVKIVVSSREGSYNGIQPTRKLSVVLEGVTKLPKSATANGKKVKCTVKGTALEIDIPELSASEKLTLVVRK